MAITSGDWQTRLADSGMEPVDVTVILVNYNTAHLLPRTLSALNASRGNLRLQVIVVDNASKDESVPLLRSKYPCVELLENEKNVGFGRANNQALTRARGRYILLLNTDAFVSPDTLVKTIGYMDQNPGCGVLGVKLLGQDGKLQPSCRYFPTPWNTFLFATGFHRYFPRCRLVDDMTWDHASIRECDWVPGCYYLVRADVIGAVGLFDPRYFLYCEEVDHCRAVKKAGWSVVYYPFTSVCHLGGESAASAGPLTESRQISNLEVESQLLHFRKHHGVLGLMNWIALSILADLMIAGSNMVRRRNFKRAATAIRHSRALLSITLATRFGSRATR